MRGQDWTAILEAAGLETPGYREAFEATNRKTEQKKRDAELKQTKPKRKRK